MIPAITLKESTKLSPQNKGQFRTGWGKRYDYKLVLSDLNGLKIAHDLWFWSWDARPKNRFSEMLSEMVNELSELTLYSADGHSLVELSPGSDFAGHELILRFQKQFQSLDPKFLMMWHSSPWGMIA